MLKTTSNTTRSLLSNARRLRILEAFRFLSVSSDSSSTLKDAEPVVPHRRNRPEGGFAKAIKRTPASNTASHEVSGVEGRRQEYSKRKGSYRSDVPLAEQRKLRPAVVSARIKAYANEDRLEDAVQMIMNAPKRALNIIVWNTLLTETMKAGRRKRAYQLYIELKKRGFKPSASTYITMMKGMSEIEDWEKNSVMLENCHKLFDSYVQFLDGLSPEEEAEIIDAKRYSPLVFYFRILGRANQSRKLFDVFYSLNSNGVLKSTTYAYGGMLHGISLRTAPELVGTLTPSEQNATDAKMIWRLMEKDVEKGLVQIDEITLRHALVGLLYGRQSDVQFALDILRDYYGLAAPGEEVPPPRFQFNKLSLQVALKLCNRAKKPRLCTYLAKQIMDQLQSDPEYAERLQLDRGHYEQMMLAYHSLADVGTLDESARAVELLRWMIQEDAVKRDHVAIAKDARSGVSNIHPSSHTFALTMTLCLRCNDWDGARQTFSFFSSLNPDEYCDEAVSVSSGNDKKHGRGDMRSISEEVHGADNMGSTAIYAQFARTALATGDVAQMRQCLRVLIASGVSHTIAGRGDQTRHVPFYRGQLASSILKMLDQVEEKPGYEDERPAWHELRATCKRFFANRPRDRVAIPPYEMPTLGSQAYVDRLERTIDFEMAARSSS